MKKIFFKIFNNFLTVICHIWEYWIPRQGSRDGPSSSICSVYCQWSSLPIAHIKTPGGYLYPRRKLEDSSVLFLSPHFPLAVFSWPPPPAPRRCLSRTYLGSSGCFSTYSTVLLRVLSPIPVAALTTLIPICASNPDLSLALDSYFSLDASTPESLRHKHLYLTSTSHGRVTFNFPLSIISHSQLVTEN